MKIISLSDITLDSSTIPANLYQSAAVTVWTAGTYSLGDQRYYAEDGLDHVWQSLENTNADVPSSSSLKWSDLGATDRYLMFDDYINTVSNYEEEIEVVIDSSGNTSVGLFNLQAREITLTQTDNTSATDVKTETVNLEVSLTLDWYSYFFAEVEYKDSLTWEFPQYSDSTLTVTITYIAGSDAECGVLKIGSGIEIGTSQYDLSLGTTDWSRTEVDSNGRVSFNPGNTSDDITITAWLPTSQVDSIRKTMKSQLGRLCILDGNNEGTDYESVLSLGYIEDSQITVPGPTVSQLSITFKGVT